MTHSKKAEKPSESSKADSKLYEFVVLIEKSRRQQVLPDDHSKLAPLLPISNRTVKRLSADDSAGSRVKVGHRQASNSPKRLTVRWGVFFRRHKNLLKKAQKRDTIEGFADRSEGKQGGFKLLGFFKNIQPISVGV